MSMISTAILEIRKREMVLQNFAMVMGRVVENMGFGKTRIQTIADMCLKCFHLVCWDNEGKNDKKSDSYRKDDQMMILRIISPGFPRCHADDERVWELC